jgi:uncharacterized flavoprotein (TIGR03862 family)
VKAARPASITDIPKTGVLETDALVIGGGPAGLMAAEILSSAGCRVVLVEKMPSLGRKFLMAGRGGLNLTHGEDLPDFLARYRDAAARLAPSLRAFGPGDLRTWCHGLGIDTFIGSSGRIFPTCLKASPLLRAWLGRLAMQSVRFELGRSWTGIDHDGRFVFRGADDSVLQIRSRATLLALGGASWPRLGSDGLWAPLLQARGIRFAPFSAANCGLRVLWSKIFAARFAGTPLKRIAVSHGSERRMGDAVATTNGLEGGPIYALTPSLRQALATGGKTVIHLDLRPDTDEAVLAHHMRTPTNGDTVTSHLRKRAGLAPVAIGLLREALGRDLPKDPQRLANAIKACPLEITGLAAIERAISSAGGIFLEELDDDFRFLAVPDMFAAGEMLDWEAPTGGYLLQASFSTAVTAARAMVRQLRQ